MTLSTWSRGNLTNSDATFRTACQDIHNALAAVGLVQTADTGQIDLATVVKPGTINTSAGYEIWRFNDALQATAPVFIKIEYGTNGANANTFGIWMTVGSSTDGAGNLGAQKSSRIQLGTATTSSATPYLCWVSGDTSRLTLMMYAGGTTGQAYFATVERTQNVSGGNTNEGIVFVYATRNAASGNQVVQFSGPLSIAASSIQTVMPAGPSWALGANVYTGPVLPLGFGVHPPAQGVLTYFNGDISQGVPQSISHYGTYRTFYPVGSANITGLGQATGATVLVRYD
jgi:hypothetical protein